MDWWSDKAGGGHGLAEGALGAEHAYGKRRRAEHFQIVAPVADGDNAGSAERPDPTRLVAAIGNHRAGNPRSPERPACGSEGVRRQHLDCQDLPQLFQSARHATNQAAIAGQRAVEIQNQMTHKQLAPPWYFNIQAGAISHDRRLARGSDSPKSPSRRFFHAPPHPGPATDAAFRRFWP